MPWIIATTLTVFLPLMLVYYYVGKKILNALVRVMGWQRTSTRNVMVGSLACVNVFPVVVLVLYLIGGQRPVSAFAGEALILDLLFVYPFWFGLVIAVQSFLLYLAADLLKLFLLPLYRRTKELWRERESRFVLWSFAVVAIYSIIIISANTWGLRVDEREVKLPPSAAALDGFRIIHIADVQGDGRTDENTVRDFVERINGLQPDLVLFAGDLITSGERYVRVTAERMGEIKAPAGRIAAVGDHDVFANKKYVMDELSANGFTIAEDTTLVLTRDGATIAITIVTHTYRQRPDGRALHKAARLADDANLKIFLVHQPAESLVTFAEQNGYHLFAAGHTHGGGIAFGIPGLFLFAPARVESRYMSGFYERGAMLVSINNGLGMTLAPIRYHAQANITLLRLVK